MTLPIPETSAVTTAAASHDAAFAPHVYALRQHHACPALDARYCSNACRQALTARRRRTIILPRAGGGTRPEG